MTSHLNFYYFYTTLFCFPYRKGRLKTKSMWWLNLKCLSKNKRQPQKLSEAIGLFRYLVLPLHLLSHNTKSYSLEIVSSPLIAVRLPNSHKSLICIRGPLSPYFLFLLCRLIFGASELF